MDMRKYTSGFIKPDHVREGPRQETIVNVYESEKYGHPVLEFESGDSLSLNSTNNRLLCQAWGFESDAWLGQTVEVGLGHYRDWRSDPPADKETVTVRAISARQASPDNGGAKATPATPKPRPSLRDEMDDEVPFALAFAIGLTAIAGLVVSAGSLIA
jgi:hypothetical protein